MKKLSVTVFRAPKMSAAAQGIFASHPGEQGISPIGTYSDICSRFFNLNRSPRGKKHQWGPGYDHPDRHFAGGGAPPEPESPAAGFITRDRPDVRVIYHHRPFSSPHRASRLHLGAPMMCVCGWVTLLSYPEQEFMHAHRSSTSHLPVMPCRVVSRRKPATEIDSAGHLGSLSACFLTDTAFAISVYQSARKKWTQGAHPPSELRREYQN